MKLASRRTRSIENVETHILEDILRRVEDIDNSYRAIALKMGQLYIHAEESSLQDLTTLLDKPLRNASENEQTFAALLDQLQMTRNQRQ